MRSLIIAGVSAVALALGGAAFAQNAQGGAAPGTDQTHSSTMHPGATHHHMKARRRDVRMAQEKLKSQGLYKGKVDGVNGPMTMAAVKEFQHQNNLRPTGKLDHATKEKLGLSMNSGSSMPPEGSSTTEGTSQPSAPPSANGENPSGTGGTSKY